ncbi:MAG: hypothetical protein ABR583_04805 [Gaiellaceae bacterium]
MHTVLGNPVRLLALVGLAAALGGAMLVLKTTQGGSETAAAPKLLHTSVRGKHGANPRGAHTKPAAKPGRTKPTPLSPVVNGLPRAVAAALVRNAIVVVSVGAPGARVDELAAREARAGADLAGAGFVQINAFRQAEVAPLEAKVQLRSNPSLLVFRRPGDIAISISGFADRESVAQAVENARD